MVLVLNSSVGSVDGSREDFDGVGCGIGPNNRDDSRDDGNNGHVIVY